jgi:hypothetical protein
MERMAQAVADGVREAGAQADIKRVPELVPQDVAKQSGYKLDQAAPIATVAYEQRMIAGAVVVAVPHAVLLLAMRRAHARIHVEQDAFRRTTTMYDIDPLAGQIGKSREVRRCCKVLPRHLFVSDALDGSNQAGKANTVVDRLQLVL